MERKILLDNGESKLWVIENFTDNLHREMKKLPLLKEPPIIVRGKSCRQRRNVGFFSDESEGYHYSNQKMYSKPLSTSPILEPLLTKVNLALSSRFNGILVNHYVNGNHYIGKHSDDEKTLDNSQNKSMVACIAFGVRRKFRVRDRKSNKIVLDYLHKPLSLLVMEGKFQRDFTHEITKEKKILAERFSATFRHHIK